MSGRRLLWVLLRSPARIIFVLAFRVRVFGRHNVPQRMGVLIVSNHQSYLDPVLLGFGLDRSVSYMARRTLFRNAAFRWLITALNTFPMTRGGRDIAAMREAVRRLRAGWCLVVFPEGTRTFDGRIGPLRSGVLAIAERAHVPVVPAVVEGAFEAWPRHGSVRPHLISVGYGPVISAEECSRMSRQALVERLGREMSHLQSVLRSRQNRARGGNDRQG